MTNQAVLCIHCHQSEFVYRHGKSACGKTRFNCKGCRRTFQGDYTYNGCRPEVKELVVKMTLNGSGIRDVARVLDISTNTVTSDIKKKSIHHRRRYVGIS